MAILDYAMRMPPDILFLAIGLLFIGSVAWEWVAGRFAQEDPLLPQKRPRKRLQGLSDPERAKDD
jgi:hypothetical protein